MQFHLNGFQAGDPTIAEPAQSVQSGDDLPTHVDVLIVGSGPAGLTLAAQLAAFPGLSVAIVEQKGGPLTLGQADGIACRTMEMFEAFGFAHEIAREACWINETVFWKPGATPGEIVRSGRVQDVEDGLSEMPHVVLNQARVHDRYLAVMANSPSRLAPHYSRRLVGLERAADDALPYPVTARLERIDPEHEGAIETVHARYVVGCDGARSTVREIIGRELRGDSANQAWGVMDVLAVTDFPDVRYKVAIQSAEEGSLLIIPREGGYLTRFYVELDELEANERIADRNVTIEHLIEVAQRILRPYTLEVKEVAWWSAYVIGQRLCDKFDDLAHDAPASAIPRIFIAGDACHTHSPKAGQGMNVSMQDTFNLGWKLAAVITGQAKPELLRTYSSERQGVAAELIDFDRKWAAMFSAQPKEGEVSEAANVVDPAEFQRFFVQHGRYTAGTATHYHRSMVRGEDEWQALATGFPIGMRFHSARVVRLADAKPLHLGHEVKADGRWRLFLFAGEGDDGTKDRAVARLCEGLLIDPDLPVRAFTPADADIDAVIDVRAIFQAGHANLAIDAMPSLLRPAKGRYGLHDYEKVFCAPVKGEPDIYSLRGIDRAKGCMVLVRPDQYVAHVLPLDRADLLGAFLSGVMVRPAG